MKVIIPVAGAGTRLRPHTHTQPKPLIPVAGKAILAHIVDNLIDAGMTDIVFVIGYLGDKIRRFVEKNYGDRIQAAFAVQEPRLGIAHAIWQAKEEIQEENEVMILLGDTIFGSDTILAMLSIKESVVAVQQVDDPGNFGIAVLGEQNYISSLKEKPSIPTSNLALVGLYKIENVALLLESIQALLEKEPSVESEYELTDALMGVIDRGLPIRTLAVENWFDCGRKQTLLQTNQILLEQLEELPDYQYRDSVIIHPVHISEGCDIQHSIIGPYVAVAENTRICKSIVSNSILGTYSELESIIIRNSVVGNDSKLRGRSHSINIGDNTEIDLEE